MAFVRLPERLRPHDSDHRSLQRASRTALVMTAVFLFGRYVVDNSQFAVMGTFTGAALLGIADFSGNLLERLRATAATLAAGAVLLALGTAVSPYTAAATVTMFVVAFLVAFSSVFSGYFAAASNAVIVFYVVATGIAGPVSSIPPREAGLAVGGALSLLAIGWLWPSRAVAASRQALADVYHHLGAAVRLLCDAGRTDEAVAECRRVEAGILTVEQALAQSAWRPDGLAGPHKARMYLLQGARRAAEIVAVLARLPHDAQDRLHGDVVDFERQLSEALDRCATGIAGGPLPDPEPVEAATDRFAAVAREDFAERTRSGLTGGGRRDLAAATFLLHQLGWGVVLGTLHCRAMVNAPLGPVGDAGRSWLVSVLFDGPSLGKWLRRARRNLTFRSVHLQNSLRLAVGLALARLMVGLFNLQHGFWVGFATLVVLKTSAAGTRATAWQAALGTGVGFGVSSIFIASFGVHDVAYAVALPIVVFAAFYLPGAVSFIGGQACFTMVIVVLFNLIKPAGWTVGLLRLEDVLVGAAIGLVIGMAIWPRGAAVELRRAVGQLLLLGSSFARATIASVVGAGPPPEVAGGSPSRSNFPTRLHVAASDVEDVFSQYLAEPHQSDQPVLEWARVIAAAHRMWFGAAVASLVPPLAPECRPSAEVAAPVLASASVVEEDYRRVAGSLQGDEPLALEPVPRPDVPGTGLPAEEVLTLLEVGTWLDELAAGLGVLEASLSRLGVGVPAASTQGAPVGSGVRRGGLAPAR